MKEQAKAGWLNKRPQPAASHFPKSQGEVRTWKHTPGMVIQWSEQKTLVNTFISAVAVVGAEAKEKKPHKFGVLESIGQQGKGKERGDASVLLWVLLNSTALILKANDKTGGF